MGGIRRGGGHVHNTEGPVREVVHARGYVLKGGEGRGGGKGD